MRSRRRQSQQLLHQVVYDQLARDDETDVHEPRLQAGEETRQAVDAAMVAEVDGRGPLAQALRFDDRGAAPLAPAPGGGALSPAAGPVPVAAGAVVGLREYDVPRLAQEARRHGRDHRREDGHDPLDVLGPHAFGQGRERRCRDVQIAIQEFGHDVERDLLPERVGDLWRGGRRMMHCAVRAERGGV
jgi:hypothetical protein